jgi:hypothetical protein
LKRKKDFKKRDTGFSLNRSIRDSSGNLVRVYDRKYKKPTLAMPDIVDFRNDVIIDLKTYFIFESPEEGGILVTVDTAPKAVPCGDSSPESVSIPEGYKDSWRELKELIEEKIGRKYASQLDRYREAYLLATGRTPVIKVFVVLYTKTYGYAHDKGYGGMRKLPNE